MYMAMSEIRYGMEDRMRRGVEDDRYDLGGFNAIRASWNKCGCVYAMPLSADNLFYEIVPLVCGNPDPLSSEASHDNGCDVLSISNPDNIAFAEELDKLFIGEDTGNHENNAVWSYDMKTASLTRVLIVPLGAETTGVYYHNSINGYAYLQEQVQHPGADTAYGRAGAAGYYGPFVMFNDPYPGNCDQSKCTVMSG